MRGGKTTRCCCAFEGTDAEAARRGAANYTLAVPLWVVT